MIHTLDSKKNQISDYRGKTSHKLSLYLARVVTATTAQIVYGVELFDLETLAVEEKQSVHYDKNKEDIFKKHIA